MAVSVQSRQRILSATIGGASSQRRAVQIVAATALALVLLLGARANAAVEVTLLEDTVVDAEALLFAASAPYGRAINGVSYQTEALLTVGNYQYAAWYHRGASDEDVYLGRRSLPEGAWEVMDTGVDMTRTTSDAHNVISLGISGDGVLHLSWDHHNHNLNLMNSVAGGATGATWNASIFTGQRSSLNPGGPTVFDVTYPRFITDSATGDMYFTYRTGYSGNGDMNLTRYDAGTGVWDSPHQIINGSGADVNPYLNGLDIDGGGSLHISWTWRPSAGGSNYDIMYVSSPNGGATWLNVVGNSLGGLVSASSPDIIIDDNNPGNGLLGAVGLNSSLMNQQTQAVDGDGRVHVIMWHADDAHAGTLTGFNTDYSDYFHYYRDPATGAWARTELPTRREVGSRPDMAYDAQGNIYAAYVTPGRGDAGGYYTDGDLVIVAATKAAGYSDWQTVYTDVRDFAGEPRIDQQRLLDAGVLSVFIQEHDDTDTNLTGTPLHILDFAVEAILIWAGDDSGTWTIGVGSDWDFDGDAVGDVAFQDGDTVRFDDSAATFAVNVVGPVTPAGVRFQNTVHAYTLTGSGIAGTGDVVIEGGGTVTLANGVNTYSGDTVVDDGALILAPGAVLALSPDIQVLAEGTVDVSAQGTPHTLNAQTLTIDGQVTGSLDATNLSTILVNGADAVTGDLSVDAGSLVGGAGRIAGNLNAADGTVRVGEAGLEFGLDRMVIDDFEAYALGNVYDVASPPWSAHQFTPQADIEATGGGNQALSFGSSGYMGVSRDLPEEAQILDGEVGTFFFRFDAVTDDPDHSFGLADRANTGGAYFGDFEAQVRLIDDPDAAGTFMFDARDGGVFSVPLAYGLTTNTWYNVWLVVDQAGDTYDVYLNTGTADADAGDKLNAAPLAFRNGTTTALNKVLGLGGPAPVDNGARFDDLTYLAGANLSNPLGGGAPGVVGDGATLTVHGDCTLAADSTLEMDLVDPAILDQLSVGETLTAGGTLHVVLAPGAPAPVPGDVFAVLDAASIAGAFDAFVLPSLTVGQVWDLRGLYTSGELAVADRMAVLTACLDCLTGPGSGLLPGCANQDFDADGDVDLHDFATLEACLGGAPIVTETGCTED